MTTDHGPPVGADLPAAASPAVLPGGVTVEAFHDTPERVEGLRLLAENAFAENQPPAAWALEAQRFEPGRGLVAVDDGQVVGSNLVYSLEVSVPGPVPAGAPTDAPPTRSVPAAAISFVCVLPSHRRRGIAASLMGRVLADVHERGTEPVAVLWASEATIYHRFGFGPATRWAAVVLPRRVGLVRGGFADPLTARLVDPAAHTAEVERLAGTVRSVRPGMLARPEHWVAGVVADLPESRAGAGALRCVLLSSGSRVRAAARYATRPATDGAHGTEVVVWEAYSDGPGSHAALVRWFTEMDLIGRVVAPRRPVDDPVLDQLSDARSAEVRQGDGLWVRLVDLAAALTARGYVGDVTAVLDVTDAVCPWNAGRWKVAITDGTATVTRTGDAPDLELDVTALAAAYLGSAGTLSRLGRAGLVTIRTPGVLDRLSRSFESAVQPWAPWVF